MEEIRWYEKLNYTETKDIIKEKLQNMSRDFVAIGFYLKLIRDKSLFLEDGYKSIWEFAEDNYGIKRSTASRWMAMNDKFSKNGNTPILSEEYISFGKSQLQEMLYLDDKQMEEVNPDMTAREIRGIRTPDPEPEEIEEEIPEQVPGQMCVEDYPEILPEEEHGPAKCITGKSRSGICGAAAYCSENYSCCSECNQNCNSRCGWLDDVCDVAQDKQQPAVENVNMDCPPDQDTCPRQNWGTSREDQHEGQKEARCIGMVWDCIRDTVDSVTLGDYQTNFIKQMTSTIERIASVFRNNGTLMADKISGVLDAMQTQLKCQQSVAKRMTVRAVLFEDLDENSPLYGAMAMGTQGLEISKTRTADGRGWDWTTAITASGIIASTIVAGILSDKTGRNWWNLETGDIQMSGRFQQYAFNGVKSLDIFDNKINLYAWDDDGNYVGSLRSFLTVDKEHKGIELMSDADDQVRLSVKRRDTETEEGQSVFIGENGYTGLFTVDGKGNSEEWISRKHGGSVWIRNMPNGDFLAGGVRIGVESGLITSIPSNSVANGTFEVISGLSWANGGITSVDWVKVNVVNGSIKNWSTRTQNF